MFKAYQDLLTFINDLSQNRHYSIHEIMQMNSIEFRTLVDSLDPKGALARQGITPIQEIGELDNLGGAVSTKGGLTLG